MYFTIIKNLISSAMNKTARRASQKPGKAPDAARGGRPALISPARILDEARGIPARELTMPVIARRLGVNPAALYYHFESRDALLAALSQQLVSDFTLKAPDPRRWRGWLHGTLSELFRFLLANRVILEVNDWSRLPVLSLRLIESVLQTLTRAGFSGEEALRIWVTASHLVHGTARTIHDAQGSAQTRQRELSSLLSDLGEEAPLTRAVLEAAPGKDYLEVMNGTLGWFIDSLPSPRRSSGGAA